MKKIFVLLCLVYAANGYAVAGRIGAAITAPILVPGVYYGVQSHIDTRVIKSEYVAAVMLADQDEVERTFAELTTARMPLYNYMKGVFGGLIPGINIAKMMNVESIGANLMDMKADEKVGFFSGLSMYGTISAMLSLLKKIK